MHRAPFYLLSLSLALYLGCSGGIDGGGIDGNNLVTPDDTVDYEIAITDAGSFAPLGTGVPTRSEDPKFGPEQGYPEPTFLAFRDAGVVDRGSFLIFDSLSGDLTEARATIIGPDGRPVRNPSPDPESVPRRIGIQIPDDLPAGRYSFELRTPTDILIADVRFELE
jgi:hypothetical protein